jgi:hypothetical protein
MTEQELADGVAQEWVGQLLSLLGQPANEAQQAAIQNCKQRLMSGQFYAWQASAERS